MSVALTVFLRSKGHEKGYGACRTKIRCLTLALLGIFSTKRACQGDAQFAKRTTLGR